MLMSSLVACDFKYISKQVFVAIRISSSIIFGERFFMLEQISLISPSAPARLMTRPSPKTDLVATQ